MPRSATPRRSPRPTASTVIRMLGALRVERAGTTVRLPRAQRRLLATLSLAASREMRQEELIERMWGDEPPFTARTSLQVHVSALRRAVPGIIVTTPEGYRLDGVSDDVSAAARLAEEADSAAAAARWNDALHTTEKGLALWYGTPVVDLADDPRALPDVQRIEDLHSRLLDRRLEALMALGHDDEAAALARIGLASDSLREDHWHRLILALYRAGRSAEALRAYREAERTLLSEVGVEPGPPLRALEQGIRLEDPELGRTPVGSPGGRLPTPTASLVGRELDLAELMDALAATRVLTIVGAPGVGKTRIAIEAAHMLLDRFPEGTWFASLAPARTEQDVTSVITTATETRRPLASLDELAHHLAPRRGLLILDNCDHLADACSAFIRSALGADGALRVLATSRRQLDVREQRVLTLEPLGVPGTASTSHAASETLRTSSMRLFNDRARAADPTFRLNAETIPIVADLCRGSGGVPLAIELAASWLPAIAIADLRRILGPSLTHRGDTQGSSLQSAIDRSVKLLTPMDNALLRALAVFRGTFALADAHAISAPDEALSQVAAGIARLVDASLLVIERRPAGRAVYRLLGPIREHLQHGGQDPATRLAFVDHYLTKARAWAPDPLVMGSDFTRLDDDIDNVREALELALGAGRVEEAGWAILALRAYFYDRYLAWESIRWTSRILGSVEDLELRAWLLHSLGSAAHNTNDLDRAARQLAESLRLFRRLHHPGGSAHCLLSIAQLHATRGAWNLCRRDAERARDLIGPDGSASSQAVAAYYVGESLAYEGHTRAAFPALTRAARLFEETDQPHRAAYALTTLTSAAVLTGDERTARRHGPRAVALARASGSSYRLGRALGAMAACESLWGDPASGRQMLIEAHSHLSPLATDIVLDFLLPAGFLLSRWGQWEWLVNMLGQIEAVDARHSVGIGVAWRRRMAAWRRDAAKRQVTATNQAPVVPMPGRELAVSTLKALEGEPPATGAGKRRNPSP